MFLLRFMGTASRTAIWLGFFAMALLATMGQSLSTCRQLLNGMGKMPFPVQGGSTFAAASLIAYWAGEFTNSYTLAKLKLITGAVGFGQVQ
jgi:hypothetical protein